MSVGMGEFEKVSKHRGNNRDKTSVGRNMHFASNELEIHDCVENYDHNFPQSQNYLEKFLHLVSKSVPINVGIIGDNHDNRECAICHGFLISPVTLSCGHSFMKHCIPVDSGGSSWDCPKCKRNYSLAHLRELKTNVIISTLLEKWWPSQQRAALSIFEDGKPCHNSSKDVMELDPADHLEALSKSSISVSAGQARAVLNDAELLVKLCPRWNKAYFYRATVLFALKKYNLAFLSFLQSYLLGWNSLESNEVKQMICVTYSLMDFSLPEFNSLLSTSLPLNNLMQKRKLAGSEGSLYSVDSMDNLCHPGDEDSDDDNVWCNTRSRSLLVNEASFQHLLDKLVSEIHQNLRDRKVTQFDVNPSFVDKMDFECPLCMRLFWKPVTTPCGHTFCCTCLERCFDHKPTCPLCKSDLGCFLAERNWSNTEFIHAAMKSLLPTDYAERKRIYDEEMMEFANAGKDLEHYIPLFICTTAFPTVPCPLHIFEPRYRLMIRQCMESGARQFGMCAYVNDTVDGISIVGTMLKIRSIQYLPDGRSIVDTIGSRRFRIIRRGMRDGYHTAAIKFLHDDVGESHSPETSAMLEETRRLAEQWFTNLPRSTQETILSHFGPMPYFEQSSVSSPDGPTWVWWVLAILPLESMVQLQVLRMTSLHKRLATLRRVFLHIQESSMLPYNL